MPLGLYFLVLVPIYGQVRFAPDTNTFFQEHNSILDSVTAATSNSCSILKHQYDSVGQQLESFTKSIQIQVDSLTNINVPVNKYVRRIDSLNQIKDEKLSLIKDKAEEIKANSIGKLDKLNLPPEFQKKINEYKEIINKLDISVPSSQFKVPDVQLPIDLNLPTPAINGVLGDGLPNLPEMNIGDAEGISKSASQLRRITDGVPRDISAENLTQVAETNLSKINEIDAVEEQLGDLPEIPMSSEEEVRKELLNQAKEAAVDHFAGKEQELKSVMDQISKYKKKFQNINNLEELEKHIKRRPNEMKGKPVIERIVPGIALQIQKKNDELFVDFNPYVGYRFTGKLTAGLGWNQRIPYNLKSYTFQTDGRIYGPRMFAEYKLWKGFSPRIEGETMNTFVPPYIRTSPNDLGGREWVWGVFAGMKKDYKFFKKINGTASVMFRLFDPHRKSPYADVINARFGFEFPMKKKESKANDKD